MKALDNILKLKSAPVVELPLEGLNSIVKKFAADGSAIFLTSSDLDLDTDGKQDPGVVYESTHQTATSIDPKAEWLNSNKLNFIVCPIGFDKRHGGNCGIGSLATVVYKDRVAHCLVADFGPKTKFGEGSIALHRALGFERIKPNKRIQDVGIDGPVYIVWYLGSKCNPSQPKQAHIDLVCQPLWEKFTK